MSKILLTGNYIPLNPIKGNRQTNAPPKGGSGFIAAHILDQLLTTTPYTVITTARSQSKADPILAAYPSHASSGRLIVALVPDIAIPSAFDSVVQAHSSSLSLVLHTASPCTFTSTNPKVDLIDPAVNGTLGILRAVARHAPGVKRVVITSSFAAVLNEDKISDPNTTFSETSWNPVTINDLHRSAATPYRASKTFAEKAAWDFVNDPANGTKFDLVTMNPPMVFGPVVHHLSSGLGGINASNERLADLLAGKWKHKIPDMGPGMLWVDVRDVATAHVKAGLEVAEAGGKRLIPTAGYFSNKEIMEVVRRGFPEYRDRLPEEGRDVGGGLPEEAKRYKYDNQETTRLLGIEWIGLEKSFGDAVRSLKQYGA